MIYCTNCGARVENCEALTSEQIPSNPLPDQMQHNQLHTASENRNQFIPGKNNATIALICGILSIVFAITAVGGTVLGILAIIQSGKAHKERYSSIGGFVTGAMGLMFSLIFLSFFLLGIFVFDDYYNDYHGGYSIHTIIYTSETS